ncbi:MAG: hypothetical protein COB49_01635 [Alphaproteobacteria bacterium]|nr:MAG: hypothetical protein COB49_01635 [Alphaproteobacteria bacterium]
MLFIKSKILAVMLVLMVFIGQATAATSNSCQMDQNIHLSIAVTSRITKDTVIHINMLGSETLSSMDDCCAQDSDCPLGDCSSVMLLSSPHHLWEVITLQRKGDRPFLVARQSPTTLYRPPISL